MAVQCPSSLARPHFQLHLNLLVNRGDNIDGGDRDGSTFPADRCPSCKLAAPENHSLRFLRLDMHGLSLDSPSWLLVASCFLHQDPSFRALVRPARYLYAKLSLF
jgi:hypothetical protein